VGLAYETSDKYDIVYDKVKFMNGWERVIISKPKTPGRHKAIMLIQGYTCYSLDNIGKHPYGQLVDKLCDKGYVVMRAEKPGMGDDTNTPDCADIDFYTELNAFAAAYEKLKTYDYVDTANIFIFGHSLGGIEAPVLAQKYHPKGIIVCGTTAVSWFEYIIEMFRFQNIIEGSDYVENENMIKDVTPLLYDLLIEKQTPKALAKIPSFDSLLIKYMEFDGDDHIWSRNYAYWQQLQDQNMAEVWKNNSENVLVVRGEGDFEAFSTAQHQTIVDMVNTYHPGKATFQLIPDMDHAFAKSKTPAESYKNGLIKGYYYNNFNDAIIEVTDKWIGGLK
jgi:dienelactone hydrolase